MSNPIDRWLTAYVDGELTPEEGRHVDALLRDHPGLGVILQRLQADRAGLRRLERRTLPQGFSSLVLSEIRARNIEIIRQRRRPALVRYFMPVAAAAAILVAVSLTARHLLLDHGQVGGGAHRLDGPGSVEPRVVRKSEPLKPGFRPELIEAWEKVVADLPSAQRVREQASHYRLMLSELGSVFQTQTRQMAAMLAAPDEAEIVEPPFPATSPTILTSPAGKASPFKTLDVRLPLFLDVRALDSKRLLDRLREDSIHHVDFACLESWKALERFQRACQSAGMKTVLDAEAARRLNNKVPAVYMAYVENASGEQIARLVEVLGKEDSAAERQKKGEGQFQSVMVQSLDEDGRKRLADALGVPPASLTAPRMPAKPAPIGVDPGKPLSNETLKSLQRAAAGQGGRPAAKPGEPVAVVVVWNPRLRAAFSKEVRDLLDAKKPAPAEGVNVVFLFRPSRG